MSMVYYPDFTALLWLQIFNLHKSFEIFLVYIGFGEAILFDNYFIAQNLFSLPYTSKPKYDSHNKIS